MTEMAENIDVLLQEIEKDEIYGSKTPPIIDENDTKSIIDTTEEKVVQTPNTQKERG